MTHIETSAIGKTGKLHIPKLCDGFPAVGDPDATMHGKAKNHDAGEFVVNGNMYNPNK